MEKPIYGRRRFLKGLAAVPLVGISGVAAYSTLIEPYRYEINEVDISIKDLPGGFDGLRMAHITDVHHSRLVPLEEVHRVVDLTLQTKPDLIVLTGDYTTAYKRYIEPCAEALGRLEAPEGVWAVLGNHDHYTDAELTLRALKRVGINVIENANTQLRKGGETLQLSGIGDWTWARTDWMRAFHGVDTKRPIVMLSHQPIVLDLPESQYLSLIVSGHTHGGQVKLPFIGAPVRYSKDFRYVEGLYRRENTQLYVSRGTGVIGLPVRFGARPEIAILKLKSS